MPLTLAQKELLEKNMRAQMKRSIPEQEEQRYIGDLAKGLNEFSLCDFEGAAKSFEDVVRRLVRLQTKVKRSIHKGAPLYYLGSANAYMKRFEDGVHNFALAYVEDTLSTDVGFERDADGAPAAVAIREVFHIDQGIMVSIKKIVNEKKRAFLKTKDWRPIGSPEEILEQAAKDAGFMKSKLLARCRKKRPSLYLPEMLTPWSLRVFVGGNYDQPLNLFLISEFVRKRGYVPRMAFQILMNPDLEKKDHENSLLLLHSCKYAIFDITSYSGWLMELERTRDYGIKDVLLVRNAMEPQGLSKKVTAMIKSMGLKPKPFKDNKDLERIVTGFLLAP